MATVKPTSCRLRTYQVGFGDCFLLTFRYPPTASGRSRDRHLLIDFGSTRVPASVRSSLEKKVPEHLKAVVSSLRTPVSVQRYMSLIAEDIAHECGGKLDVVVATHRHKDHIDGFRTNDSGTAPGNIIASLKPDIVLLPWTEDPDAEPDALTPTGNLRSDQSFARSLAGMQAFAGAVERQVSALRKTREARQQASISGMSQLQFLGENNLANRAAIENLLTMGRRQPRFLSFGKDPGLGRLLPGVDVDVLGPPTAKQWQSILKQRSTDPDEFWHLQADFWSLHGEAAEAAVSDDDELLYPEMSAALPPAHARWLASRMDRLNVQQTLQIVRIVDQAMNNTSLILLFRTQHKSLLFPGDAQIENWLYALREAPNSRDIRKALAKTDFYKVGHHGSLNATPKSLWTLFDKRSDDETDAQRLDSVVSTRSGVHGSRSRGTEVPRSKLVDALKRDSNFKSTQRAKRMFFDLEWDVL
ncbi:MAG: hypothetical protein R3C19_21845 [Planctomycetaceae bacterium]